MRKATNKILEMLEEGILDKDTLITACLNYMSEDDVADMANANDIQIEEEEDDEAIEEDDTDPNGDWYDTSAELD